MGHGSVGGTIVQVRVGVGWVWLGWRRARRVVVDAAAMTLGIGVVDVVVCTRRGFLCGEGCVVLDGLFGCRMLLGGSEVGHWLGLEHTFANGWEEPGDVSPGRLSRVL